MAGLVFIVFGLCLVLAIPICVAMIMGAWAPVLLHAPGVSGVGQLIRFAFSGADSTPIIALPLFIFAGVIMAEGGISRRLFNVFTYLVGKKTGGIPIAVILTTLFYSSISGSGPATTAAVGAMAIPFMIDMGYDKTWSGALVAVTGGLGVILPPSIPFVLYSLATGVSTGQLFLAGILPGMLVGFSLVMYAYLTCRRKGENKEKISLAVNELRKNSFLKLFKDSFWALLSPLVVLGGIYSGFFTPTEAACVSVFYALFISIFIYKSMPIKNVPKFLCTAVKTYAPICFVIAFAIAFGRILALLKAPDVISGFLMSTFSSKELLLIVVVIVFYAIGMVMDIGPAIVIMSPILLPVVEAMGVDPVHFGVIMVVNLAISLATPPFGLNMFVAASITEKPVMKLMVKGLPAIAAFSFALIIITFIPQVSLLLLGR